MIELFTRIMIFKERILSIDQYRIESFKGQDIFKYIQELANLRIEVFCEWPYLYDGHLDYEKEYLKKYAQSENSFIGIAFYKGEVIGMTTAIPLEEADKEFQAPFETPSDYLYWGESVIRKDHRGHRIGHEFFKLREDYAKQLKKKFCTFCAVIRDDSHPRRPFDYKDLGSFWQRMGFEKLENEVIEFPWQDLDEKEETLKPMSIWVKPLA